MREVSDDFRYAWRQLRRTPGFTAIAVLTLALGIGASTTFYALTDAVLWRPFRHTQRLNVMQVELVRPARKFVPGKPESTTPWLMLTPEQLDHLSGKPELGIIAAARLQERGVVLQTTKGAIRATLVVTSGDFASVYGVRPLVGHLSGLGADGPSAGPSIVISEALWRQLFQSDPGIVGRETLRLDGRTFTIAGVVDRDYAPYMTTDIWVADESWRLPGDRDRIVTATIRVRPEMEASRLRPMLDAALTDAPTPPPPEYKVSLIPAGGPRSYGAYIARYSTVIIGLSSLVLLAACANLANMLYARAAQRTGEIAVRLSLGAGTTRIFRLFLLEAVLVAAAAAILGIGMTLAALRFIRNELPASDLTERLRIPFELIADWRTFAWAAMAGLLSALIVGSVTAWRGSRTPPLRMFGASGIAMSTTSRGKWMRTLMIAVQVSTAVILLLGTGLFLIRGLTAERTTFHYDTARLATATFGFDNRFHDGQVTDLTARILERVKTIDGLENAAVADGLVGGAYSGGKLLRSLIAEDESMPGQMSGWRRVEGQQAAVSPEFFATVGLTLQRGRLLTANDQDGASPVVVLSQSMAANTWPGLDPIGRHVRLGSDPRWFTVVGVVNDPISKSNDNEHVCASCVAFTSWRQKQARQWVVIMRSSAPASVADQVVRAVADVNETIPVFSPSVAERSIFLDADPRRLLSRVVGALGLLSLAIAALGVYGVISYSVSRRTREFGIRLALGATPRGILRAVLDDAVHLVLVGLLPGVLLAAWATRVLESSIVQLMPNDIPTWAAVPLLILAIGLLAAYMPARRAARVDPNIALRDL